MKLLKLITGSFLSGGICLCLILSSCAKKQLPTPTPVATGTLMLHFHTNVDSSEVELYNTIYLANGNRKISVSLAQLYVSGIQLVKADGSTYDVPNLNVLKVMEIEEYLVGSVPAGNYKSIKFNVGLSPATNTAAPAANDSTLNKPDMWLGSTAQASGFVFVNFQGKIDTSQHANGTVAQMQPFTYRIGTNAHLQHVSMPDQNYSVLPNQAQFVHITIDYNKLFTGIQLNTAGNLSVTTTADNATPLAAKIATNIPTMFSYEE